MMCFETYLERLTRRQLLGNLHISVAVSRRRKIPSNIEVSAEGTLVNEAKIGIRLNPYSRF